MRRMGWVALGAALVAAGLAVAWYAQATNVERPAYAVERAEGAFELRAYPAMVAAEVAAAGDRQAAVRAGFSPLARYIFARERAEGADDAKIAMTAPVTQTGRADGGWSIRFIMPAGAAADALPRPAGAVRLVDWPAHRAAAVRFSGRWTDARFAAAEARLRAWMEKEGLVAAGPATYAYYNDPFTPAFLRRNEVLVPVGD